MQIGPLVTEQPLWPRTMPEPHEVDRLFEITRTIQRDGITVLNAPGTIDADYRGEIGVILINLGASFHTISRGARIAQLIVSPVTRIELIEDGKLSGTSRGDRGFGSTDANLRADRGGE